MKNNMTTDASLGPKSVPFVMFNHFATLSLHIFCKLCSKKLQNILFEK